MEFYGLKYVGNALNYAVFPNVIMYVGTSNRDNGDGNNTGIIIEIIVPIIVVLILAVVITAIIYIAYCHHKKKNQGKTSCIS